LRLSSINGEIDGGKDEEAQYILYRDTYSLQTTARIIGFISSISSQYVFVCASVGYDHINLYIN